MLSLRKKPDAAAPFAAAWHTNFRNFERLPDTKAVRTAFFINGTALLGALGALLFFVYQEFSRRELAQEIAAWEAQIAADRAGSSDAVAKYRRFQAEERKVAEVAAFMSRQLAPSEFVLRLGDTLPPQIALNHIDCQLTRAVLRGGVRGPPNEASGRAQDYVAQLGSDEVLGQRFDSVRLTSLSRSSVTGELSFEVVLTVETSKSPPKKR